MSGKRGKEGAESEVHSLSSAFACSVFAFAFAFALALAAYLLPSAFYSFFFNCFFTVSQHLNTSLGH